MREINFVDALNEALHEEMENDKKVICLGEDVELAYVFGVTKGLKDKFGAGRVRDTPISELGFVGAAVGAAMAGYRPVVEIMFMDFIMLAMDPLVSQAAKLRYMTGGQAKVPLVIRAPVCTGIGMGAQHSQSLESWFAHVPGLIVIMPSTPLAAKGLLQSAIRSDNPVIFLESRHMYSVKGPVPEHDVLLPIGEATVHREGGDLTFVATGRMVTIALSAANKLAEQGVEAEVVDPQTLKPLDTNTILESVKRTSRLVVVNEGCRSCGYAAEIAATIAELAFDYLDAPIEQVTSRDVPMPVSKVLENEIVPREQDLLDAARRTIS